MSNSSLANYIDRSNSSYIARTTTITGITIHSIFNKTDSDEDMDIYALTDLINASSSGYSFHYGIDNKGTIGLFVDECFQAHGTTTLSSGNSNDNRTVQIVVMNCAGSGYPISDACYSALVNLVEDICRRNYIQTMTYLPANHGASTLTLHSWYGGSSCPSVGLQRRFSSLVTDVNSRLSSAKLASTETASLKARSTISLTQTSPFIAIPDADALGIDYASYRYANIIGVMLYAGSYFDSNHNVNSRYKNPYLKRQIAELAESSLPHALYCDVRARSVEEAKKECYELYFVVSKYPPKLGIWLHLELTGIPSTRAKAIVDLYYKNIYKWGLKDKCGFYCNAANAELIDWPSYTDRFCLWLCDDMIGDISEIDAILTPAMFKF